MQMATAHQLCLERRMANGLRHQISNSDRRLTFWNTVKYHAYLRKMTRYNPTRGGESTLPYMRDSRSTQTIL